MEMEMGRSTVRFGGGCGVWLGGHKGTVVASSIYRYANGESR